MLRTAMLSTQPDRYYGPPDGISTGEFDSLTRAMTNGVAYDIDVTLRAAAMETSERRAG